MKRTMYNTYTVMYLYDGRACYFYKNVAYLAFRYRLGIMKLENELGLSNGVFRRGNRNNYLPNLNTIQMVAKYFHLTFDEILFKDLNEEDNKINEW